MKPFIEGEIERVHRLATALKTMKQRVSVLKDIDPENSRLIGNTGKQLSKDYLEYENAKAEILKYWESEEKPQGIIVHREDVVIIAEAFNYEK